MNTFISQVWELTKQIPIGKVTTYKEISKQLNVKAYRAIGYALNKNRNPDVPCHRVINSNGQIGGFAYGPKRKIQLLEQEGIEIKNNKIDLNKYLFRFD